jgi:nucleotide-binding universal stress UspA family protein
MGGIVVGIDGSGSSAAAVRWAVQEARLRAAILHLVFASDDKRCPRAPYAGLRNGSRPDGAEPGESALGAAAREATKAISPGHVLVELAEGSPARVLIDRSAGADLLVLGTACHRCQSASEGPPFVGPVVRNCLRGAACPVVVVTASGLPVRPG